MSVLATPATLRSLLAGPLYACAGAAFLIAGAGVAVLNSVEPFEHGWWVVSFWALVGGVAQALIGAGHRALAPQPGRRVARLRAWFRSFLGFMAISVLVGTALAWDLPWV